MLKCPICNCTEFRFLYSAINADYPDRQRIPIKKCKCCSIILSDDGFWESSSKEIPKEFNEEVYFTSYYGEKVSKRFLNHIFIKFFQYERQHKVLDNRLKGRILDIGCGDGTFLDYLSSGWEKYGYEPSKTGSEQLKMREGITSFNITKSMTLTPQKRFDIITLWQSFEHISYPGELLVKVKELLKEKGTLFISVPNYDSFQAKIFNKNWFHLDPLRHYFHYTINTLTTLVRKYGFEVQSINTVSFEYGVFGWWQSLFNLMNLEFNMGYKILKGRKHYNFSFKYIFQLLIYLYLGIPVLLLALIMTFAESFLHQGAVINLKVKRV